MKAETKIDNQTFMLTLTGALLLVLALAGLLAGINKHGHISLTSVASMLLGLASLAILYTANKRNRATLSNPPLQKERQAN